MYVICSGLGPARARCGKCATVYPTGRLEWAEMATLERVRYVAVSIVHACALGVLGGITGSLAAYGLKHGFRSTVPGNAFFGASFYASAACYAALVAVLQVLRVHRSQVRVRARAKEPIVTRLKSLDFALQLKLLALIWVPVLASDLVGSTNVLAP
jgi:hypothetical protein